MKNTTIIVKGMHCQSCEMLLTDVLTEMPGVEKAQVSLKEAKATVEYDPTLVDEKDLRKAIEAEGYKTA